MLTSEEVHIIARQIQSEPKGSKRYKRAVNKLVSHNLRLVVRSVHLFMSAKTRRSWGSADTMDFLQVGALGLVRAAEKYDPTMGYTFATYATYWIRSFVGRYSIKTYSSFHIPENAARDAFTFEKHGKLKGKSDQYGRELVERVKAAQSPASLYSPITNDGSLAIVDILESTYGDPVTFDGFSEEMEDLMKLAQLTKDQIKVLKCMFVEDMKVKDIVKATDLTRNQVSNMKKIALNKLKSVIDPV